MTDSLLSVTVSSCRFRRNDLMNAQLSQICACLRVNVFVMTKSYSDIRTFKMIGIISKFPLTRLI